MIPLLIDLLHVRSYHAKRKCAIKGMLGSGGEWLGRGSISMCVAIPIFLSGVVLHIDTVTCHILFIYCT